MMIHMAQKYSTGVLMDLSLMCQEVQISLLRSSNTILMVTNTNNYPSCLWSKVWDPLTILPDCVITHCVDPPDLPPEFGLEEDTSNWTRVNQTKNYSCRGSSRVVDK